MQSPASDYSNRPPKRMRLGTQSCAECRRRKVRCIFNPGSNICKECSLHESECVPQQRSQSKKQPKDGGNVNRRLDDLEGMIRHLCEAIHLNTTSSDMSEIRATATEALKHFHPPSLSPGRTSSSYDELRLRTKESTNAPESDTFNTPSDSEDGFDIPPLISLFKEAVYIQRSDDRNHRNGSKYQMKYIIQSLKALLPNFEDLGSILKVTESYWPIWTAISRDLIPPSTADDKPSAAREFFFDSLKSNSPMIAAKALLFLCLCIQQLPIEFRNLYLRNIQISPSELLDRYLDGADALLYFDERVRRSLDGIECLLLEWKIYFNMGKPRKAFWIVRSALNSALLLGLHEPEKYTNARKRSLWAQVWQGERILSCVLGLPSATSDSHPGLSKKYALDSPDARLVHDIAVICGHVNERNQNHDYLDYSATAKISQELQACVTTLPSGFMDTEPTPEMPLETIYHIQALKLYYYNLVRAVHSPYIFQSASDKDTEHSRISGLNACRELIKEYNTMRTVSGSVIIVCDVMDYIAFSSALMIIVTLFSQRYALEPYQETRDWELIHSVIRNQQRLVQLMECNVACQSVRVLEYLSAVYHGTYNGPEIFETVIPYFGKVRIKQFNNPGSSSYSNSRTATETAQSTPPDKSRDLTLEEIEPFSSTVEFSTNLFSGFGSDGSIGADYFSGEELGVDWASILQIDGTYEWSQLYNDRWAKQNTNIM